MKTVKINNTDFTKKDAEKLRCLLDDFLSERGEMDSPEGKKLRQVLRDNIPAVYDKAN